MSNTTTTEEERNTALLHLLALTQGLRLAARKAWDRNYNHDTDTALSAISARLDYLTGFVRHTVARKGGAK